MIIVKPKQADHSSCMFLLDVEFMLAVEIQKYSMFFTGIIIVSHNFISFCVQALCAAPTTGVSSVQDAVKVSLRVSGYVHSP